MMRFVTTSIILLIFSFLLTLLGLIGSLTVDPELRTALSEAGQFAATILGLGGLTVAITALYAQIQSGSVEQRASDEVWFAKQHLETTLHSFAVMVITVIKKDLQNKDVDAVSARSAILGQARRNLSEALERARKADLYRTLYGVRIASGHSVGAEMATLEAHVNYDLATQSDEIGLAYIVALPDLYDALKGITRSEIKLVKAKLDPAPIERFRKAASSPSAR